VAAGVSVRAERGRGTPQPTACAPDEELSGDSDPFGEPAGASRLVKFASSNRHGRADGVSQGGLELLAVQGAAHFLEAIAWRRRLRSCGARDPT